MARVIKADPQEKPAAPKRRAERKPVIAKEVYKAQQRAQEIDAVYAEKREEILAEGRQQAAQAREEAQTTGAEEAFAQAASEALASFRARAARYGEAGDDIKVLALEVVRKIFGSASRLGDEDIDRILLDGLDELRGRRKLRVQVPAERLEALATERPVLLDALNAEPDLLVEAVDDVSPGFARVVTEVGGALCTEQSALDQLAESIDVDETAVAPRPKSAVVPLDDLDDDYELEDFEDFDGEETAAAGHQVGSDPDKTDVRRRPKEQKIKVQGGLKPLDEPGDPERTMALDVSQLREDLSEDDDLDLYTDESLPD
jgi:flagellar biosynthesis/type III secretory pathway protein FliH